jgi:hypothetical protein
MNIHSSSGPRAGNHPPCAAFFRQGETIEVLPMKALSKAFLIGVGALAMTASAASAAIVCNDEGDCWRVRGRPAYGPELRLSIHPDSWKWSRHDRHRWREPGHGHGYWRGGNWIVIR